jgi:hypothetical protein
MTPSEFWCWSSEQNAVVNPKLDFNAQNENSMLDNETQQPVQPISFDVAVTAGEANKTQGGIAVFTGMIGLGSKGQSDKSNETINRIQFSVPVLLPIGDR